MRKPQLRQAISKFKCEVVPYHPSGHPAFAEPLSPVIVPLGVQAVFECTVLSNPPATVMWSFDSQPLNESERVSITPSSLTISNVQASDEGFYECVAENVFGSSTTSARLTIGGE